MSFKKLSAHMLSTTAILLLSTTYLPSPASGADTQTIETIIEEALEFKSDAELLALLKKYVRNFKRSEFAALFRSQEYEALSLNRKSDILAKMQAFSNSHAAAKKALKIPLSNAYTKLLSQGSVRGTPAVAPAPTTGGIRGGEKPSAPEFDPNVQPELSPSPASRSLSRQNSVAEEADDATPPASRTVSRQNSVAEEADDADFAELNKLANAYEQLNEINAISPTDTRSGGNPPADTPAPKKQAEPIADAPLPSSPRSGGTRGEDQPSAPEFVAEQPASSPIPSVDPVSRQDSVEVAGASLPASRTVSRQDSVVGEASDPQPLPAAPIDSARMALSSSANVASLPPSPIASDTVATTLAVALPPFPLTATREDELAAFEYAKAQKREAKRLEAREVEAKRIKDPAEAAQAQAEIDRELAKLAALPSLDIGAQPQPTAPTAVAPPPAAPGTNVAISTAPAGVPPLAPQAPVRVSAFEQEKERLRAKAKDYEIDFKKYDYSASTVSLPFKFAVTYNDFYKYLALRAMLRLKEGDIKGAINDYKLAEASLKGQSSLNRSSTVGSALSTFWGKGKGEVQGLLEAVNQQIKVKDPTGAAQRSAPTPIVSNGLGQVIARIEGAGYAITPAAKQFILESFNSFSVGMIGRVEAEQSKTNYENLFTQENMQKLAAMTPNDRSQVFALVDRLETQGKVKGDYARQLLAFFPQDRVRQAPDAIYRLDTLVSSEAEAFVAAYEAQMMDQLFTGPHELYVTATPKDFWGAEGIEAISVYDLSGKKVNLNGKEQGFDTLPLSVQKEIVAILAEKARTLGLADTKSSEEFRKQILATADAVNSGISAVTPRTEAQPAAPLPAGTVVSDAAADVADPSAPVTLADAEPAAPSAPIPLADAQPADSVAPLPAGTVVSDAAAQPAPAALAVNAPSANQDTLKGEAPVEEIHPDNYRTDAAKLANPNVRQDVTAAEYLQAFKAKMKADWKKAKDDKTLWTAQYLTGDYSKETYRKLIGLGKSEGSSFDIPLVAGTNDAINFKNLPAAVQLEVLNLVKKEVTDTEAKEANENVGKQLEMVVDHVNAAIDEHFKAVAHIDYPITQPAEYQSTLEATQAAITLPEPDAGELKTVTDGLFPQAAKSGKFDTKTEAGEIAHAIAPITTTGSSLPGGWNGVEVDLDPKVTDNPQFNDYYKIKAVGIVKLSQSDPVAAHLQLKKLQAEFEKNENRLLPARAKSGFVEKVSGYVPPAEAAEFLDGAEDKVNKALAANQKDPKDTKAHRDLMAKRTAALEGVATHYNAVTTHSNALQKEIGTLKTQIAKAYDQDATHDAHKAVAKLHTAMENFKSVHEANTSRDRAIDLKETHLATMRQALDNLKDHIHENSHAALEAHVTNLAKAHADHVAAVTHVTDTHGGTVIHNREKNTFTHIVEGHPPVVHTPVVHVPTA